MSAARARANQRLYHAKILIGAWELALQQEQVPGSVLEQAFAEPVSLHLAAAYGWFLLEVAQPAEAPATLPRACGELPAVEEGLKTAPEILEFTQLEREPWLARLIRSPGAAISTVPVSPPSQTPAAATLAVVSVSDNFDPAEARLTHDRLQALFDRMTDSLDEY